MAWRGVRGTWDWRKKRAYLGYTRDAGAIAAMRAIKRALDPFNLLNPGKVFLTRAGRVEPHWSAVMLRLISTVLSRRLIAAIPTLLMLSLIVFVVLRLIPADPARDDAAAQRHARRCRRSCAINSASINRSQPSS